MAQYIQPKGQVVEICSSFSIYLWVDGWVEGGEGVIVVRQLNSDISLFL